jgi:hypothetical protein
MNIAPRKEPIRARRPLPAELVAVADTICAISEPTTESLRLAMSVAYELGRFDGIAATMVTP